ncbi:nascent polypeptide-associated complex protein [Candidatus Woesearchaeota archaeon]|jgi:nascent polypeptide-associated complex subunit alpha|nr:nascent polypeptide-associated complex protein [Candidatus Woesearchaeota archaeon]MBT4110314.1 nascent polypeptide-associated complex protein [Candidatus Woesearchaeota archaeon]MBT4336162.1 nascent polypeptide-associated complex protein [Candidatus Woesearchaeota archaeon]MBT4468859.1 nascent polypeptide-associated complex protein [Candidatus Woesearchaeota archaeon]MBT6744822.1 nascent polypeptide-associated complex protein [Candidatus Woesearchaeota archaeon]
MMPGMNPRKMQQMMKQMGIQQVDIPATEVIIKTADKEIIITNPSVAKVNMMGQENFQISGNVEERELSTAPDISEDDVKTVMEQANVSEEQAKAAIEGAEGDLAEAIMSFNKEE